MSFVRGSRLRELRSTRRCHDNAPPPSSLLLRSGADVPFIARSRVSFIGFPAVYRRMFCSSFAAQSSPLSPVRTILVSSALPTGTHHSVVVTRLRVLVLWDA